MSKIYDGLKTLLRRFSYALLFLSNRYGLREGFNKKDIKSNGVSNTGLPDFDNFFRRKKDFFQVNFKDGQNGLIPEN